MACNTSNVVDKYSSNMELTINVGYCRLCVTLAIIKLNGNLCVVRFWLRHWYWLCLFWPVYEASADHAYNHTTTVEKFRTIAEQCFMLVVVLLLSILSGVLLRWLTVKQLDRLREFYTSTSSSYCLKWCELWENATAGSDFDVFITPYVDLFCPTQIETVLWHLDIFCIHGYW